MPASLTSDYGPCSSQDPELSGPCQRPLCKGLPVLPWSSFSQGQSSKVIPSLGTPVEPKALLGYTKQPTGSIEKAGWSQEQGTVCRFPCPSHTLQNYFFFFTRTLVWADGGEVYGYYGPREGRGWGHTVSGPLSFSISPSTVERGQLEAVIYSHKGLFPLQRLGGAVWTSSVTCVTEYRT